MFSFHKQFFLVMSIFYMISYIFSSEACAYIDPGSGSYMFQLVVAFLLGGLFTITTFWNKIVSFFRRWLFRRKE